MAKRGRSARQKGHGFEREIAQLFRELGWTQCLTSRNESKTKDDKGVDLCFTDPWNVQCKAVESLSPSLHVIIKEMPQDDKSNVVFHKKNKQGTIVAMSLESFIKIIKERRNHVDKPAKSISTT